MKTTQRSPKKFVAVALGDHRVGAVSTSSPHLVERVLSSVVPNVGTVVEYGSGDGVMTRALLRRLAPDGKLFAIETNPDFVAMLREIKDDRITVLPYKAEVVMQNVNQYGIPQADLVISSIPFSFLTPAERDGLISDSYSALKKGGMCIVFHQYIPVAKQVLQKYFGQIKVAFEWRNLFPCFIFIATKKTE